jgi:ABC-type sugar transport system substrate-binding protein
MDNEMREQAEKADGIAVCLIDAKAFDAPTANALAAGIPVIGYNADVPTGSPNKRISYIHSGDTTFTTDQQPYLQGFVPLQQMYLYKLSGGAVAPADTNTSLAYVTKENVELYLGKSRFEGSTSAEPT